MDVVVDNVDAPREGRSLEDLPYEVSLALLGHLEPHDLAAVAQTSRAMRDAAYADVVWRAACVRMNHGDRIDFQENVLGSFSHPDAKAPAPPDDAHDHAGPSTPVPPSTPSRMPSRRSEPASGGTWREVYRSTRASLASTVCIDTGRGYAKFGLASEARPRTLQICMPNAEASQDTLYQVAFSRLGYGRTSERTGVSLIVSEPFVLASQQATRVREAWRRDTERRLLQSFKVRRLAIVDSASLALFANKLTTGVVVNIGFGATFVVPVVAGHILRPAIRMLDLSGMDLTQKMAELLDATGHELYWRPEMGGQPIAAITVVRNLKERALEAFPTSLRDRLGVANLRSYRSWIERTDAPLKRVELGEVPFIIGWERFACAEVLFGDGSGDPECTLQCGIMKAVEAATTLLEDPASLDEGVASAAASLGRLGDGSDAIRGIMLRSIVLSGGSAAIAGLPERLGSEIRQLYESEKGWTPEELRVYPAHESDATPWRGAQVLAGTSTFNEHWCVHSLPDGPESDSDSDSNFSSDEGDFDEPQPMDVPKYSDSDSDYSDDGQSDDSDG